jgi:hypothetical protein
VTYRLSVKPRGHELEKVLEGGESYLLATFDGPEAATATLTMLVASLEAKSGATVEFGAFSTDQGQKSAYWDAKDWPR